MEADRIVFWADRKVQVTIEGSGGMLTSRRLRSIIRMLEAQIEMLSEEEAEAERQDRIETERP